MVTDTVFRRSSLGNLFLEKEVHDTSKYWPIHKDLIDFCLRFWLSPVFECLSHYCNIANDLIISIYQSIYLSIYLPIYLSIYQSIYLYIFIYTCTSKKPTLLYVTAENIKKSHIFSYRYISELYPWKIHVEN